MRRVTAIVLAGLGCVAAIGSLALPWVWIAVTVTGEAGVTGEQRAALGPVNTAGTWGAAYAVLVLLLAAVGTAVVTRTLTGPVPRIGMAVIVAALVLVGFALREDIWNTERNGAAVAAKAGPWSQALHLGLSSHASTGPGPFVAMAAVAAPVAAVALTPARPPATTTLPAAAGTDAR